MLQDIRPLYIQAFTAWILIGKYSGRLGQHLFRKNVQAAFSKAHVTVFCNKERRVWEEIPAELHYHINGLFTTGYAKV